MPDILLKDLKDEIARRSVVLFAGEELSALLTHSSLRHLATRVGLLRHGIERCVALQIPLPGRWKERQLEALETGDSAEVFTVAEQVRTRLRSASEGEYGRWLVESVGALRGDGVSVISAVLDLNLPIITTAYDGILEEGTGFEALTWKDGAAIERVLRGDAQGVIHIHGHYRWPGTVVLGVRASIAVETNEHTQAVLRAVRMGRTLLFLGIDAEFDDPDLTAFLDWSRTAFAKSHYRHYRLAWRPGTRSRPASDRIHDLRCGNSLAEVAAFLRGLAQAESQRVSEPARTAQPVLDAGVLGPTGSGTAEEADVTSPFTSAQRLFPFLQPIAKGAGLVSEIPDPWPHADAEVRCELLLRQIGLPDASHIHLVELWTGRLSKGPAPVTELLELGRTATLRDGQASPSERWQQALRMRIAVAGTPPAPMIDVFTPGMPEEERERWLEMAPMLQRWPDRLRKSPEWAKVRNPIPSLPDLPLDEVWVETCLLDATDLERQDGVPEPAGRLLDRLRGTAVVIGAPGGGKTTLMRWMARRLVLDPDGRFLMPLYVPLREFAKVLAERPKLGLLEYAVELAGVAPGLQHQWWTNTLSYLATEKRETVLMLLDGWDEVPPEFRDPVLRQIADHAHGFSMLISSRLSGHPRQLPSGQFFEIVELSEEGVDRLCRKWLGTMRRGDLADPLADHIRKHPDLGKLSRNPFVLSLLCAIAASSPSGRLQLPASRTALYEETVARIRDSHNERYPEAPFDRSAERTASRLAFWLLSEAPQAPAYVFQTEDAERVTGSSTFFSRVLAPSRLVDAANPEARAFQFLHTTIQEYFAARRLVELDAAEQETYVVSHAHDGSWGEILKFAAGLVSQQGLWRHLSSLAQRPDRFGVLDIRLARLVAEQRPRDGGQALLGVDLRPRLWRGIARGVQDSAFAAAFLELDPFDLLRRIDELPKTAAPQLRSSLLRIRRLIARRETAQAAVDAIRAGTAGLMPASSVLLDAPALAELRTMAAVASLASSVRSGAIRMLGHVRDFGAVDVLIKLLDDPGLSEPAATALGSIGGPAAVQALARRLDRGTVFIEALGVCQDREATSTLLQALAAGPAEGVHLLEILRGLSERPFNRGGAMLTRILESATDPDVRTAAAWALAGCTETGVTDSLMKAAMEDRDAVVRAASLMALKQRARPVDASKLEKLVRDGSAPVDARDRALEALYEMTGRLSDQDDGPYLASLALRLTRAILEVPKGVLASTAAGSASILGEAALDILLKVVRSREADPEVREMACQSLKKLGNAVAAPDLEALVREMPDSEQDPETVAAEAAAQLSRAAAEALARIEPARLLAIPGGIPEAALLRLSIESGVLVFEDRLVWPGERLEAKGSKPVPVGEPKLASADGETGVVRILHLSDFHFSEAKRWDQDPVMRALLDDVEGLVKAGLGPHLIAVTGDIAQSGQRKEYTRASEWFTELLKRTKLAPTDLLLVTGNHDVDRGEVKGKVGVDALQEELLDAKSQEKIASALEQKPSRKLLLERHAEWHRFASKATGTKRDVPWWTLERSVNGVPLHIAGFCSSWMSWRDNEQGSLLLGRWQVHRLQPKSNGALAIALMHHPFSYFADWDGQEVEEAVQHHFAVVLRGHLHRQKQEQRVSDPKRLSLLVTTGSCYAGSKYPNAYQLIELRPLAGEARTHLRIWNGLKWIPDRNAYDDGTHGVITRPLRRPSARGYPPRYTLRSDGAGDALTSREQQIDNSRLANSKLPTEPYQIGHLTLRIEQMGTSLAASLPASVAREVVSLLGPMLVSSGSDVEGRELGIYEAKIGTARDLLHAGEIAAARKVLNDLEREIADRSVPTRIRYRIATVLGACARGDDDTVEVRRQFEKALAFDQDNPRALANRALAALLERDLDTGYVLAERALASAPRDGHAMGVLLQVLYHKGDQARLEALVGSEAWMQDDLGCRAALGWIRFEQGRYPEAEKLLRAVVEAEPFNTSLRTALVGSIMGPIEADLVDAPLVGWATPADRRRRLDEAEGLQSETIRILEKRQQPEQLSTAILRRSHIRLLGDRQKEALSDCERVLSDAPERPDALRLRGIMALHEPDPDLAVSCLEKASRTFGLDVTIPLAEAHLLNGNPRRAAELLSPVLHQPKLGSRSLARAAEGLLLAYRRLGNAEGREEVLRALAQFAPDCPFALVIRAREAYRGGIAAEAERLLRTAAERAKPHERAVIILELGAFLDHAGQHGEAADCYREVVQTPGDTPGTHRLVVALYKAGRLREARDTAAKARGDGPPLVPATEIEATLRDIQGDLMGSRALWTRLAEHFPKNPRYVIQTALIDMRLGKEGEARAALDQVQIEAIEEEAEALVKAAQGRLALGMPDALEYCYQALRAGFDDPKTHMAYVTLFLRTRGSDFQQPTVAEEGTVVRFQVHGQEEEVLILRPGVRARLPFEKGTDDPAVRRLLGHKRGDEVLIGGSSLNPYTVTITDIKNRYVAAYQDSMARFQFRFPDQNFVESITGDTAHTLTKVFAIVEAAQKEGGVLVSEYAQGSLPIYAISTLTGRSVYEVWRSLALDSSAGVCASVPSPDPRSAHGVKGLVCDAVSLFTLQHLDALDVFFESCGPIFVPTQVRDELASALLSAVPWPGEAGSLQKTGDYFALVKLPDPSRNGARVFLQAILDFIDRNCVVSGSDAVLDYSQESIQEEVRWWGSGFYALLLARERGLPLLSDDQALRIVAAEVRVPSFWTHQWLLALAPETISMDHYRGLVVKLMKANYRYPVLTAGDFRWALAQESFEPNAETQQVLRYLSGDYCLPGPAVWITAYLIRSAVLSSLLPLRENALVHLMLDALLRNRFAPPILRELEKALGAGLGLLPIHHARITETMKAWRKARYEKQQTLVT